MPSLTAGEYSCVRFIFDRTAGWNKKWEKIPLRHFTDGFHGRDGRFWGASALKTRNSVISNIKKLLEKKIILREACEGDTYKYSLNYDEIALYVTVYDIKKQ